MMEFIKKNIMEKEKKIKGTKKELQELEELKKKNKGKGNISAFFGANPNEIDGVEFQKIVRKEWQ